MKCKTVRNIDADVNCHPPYVSMDVMGRPVIAAGTIICRDEFPLANCVALVQNGLADPVDDECRKACNRTQVEIDAAKAAMARMFSVAEDNDDDSEDDEDDDE